MDQPSASCSLANLNDRNGNGVSVGSKGARTLLRVAIVANAVLLTDEESARLDHWEDAHERELRAVGGVARIRKVVTCAQVPFSKHARIARTVASRQDGVVARARTRALAPDADGVSPLDMKMPMVTRT